MRINLLFKDANLSRIVLPVLFLTIFSSIVLAQAPCGENDYDCQIAAATKTIQLNPNSVDGYTKRGDAYYNKGSYELSIKDYSQVLELDPKNAEIWGYRGDAYNKLNNYDQAISDYSKSIILDPTNAVTYINRGNSYDNNGRFDLAMKDYNKAIELDPDNDSAYYNRGIALYFQKKYSQAISDFQKALQLNPKFAAAENYLEKAQAANNGQGNIKEDNSQSETTTSQTTNRSNGSPSETDVKNWVNEYEKEINPTGGISSPISISLSFKQIQFEVPRPANEGDKLRKVASNELYPVIVQYTVNQKFSDGTYPKEKKYKFELYRNQQGGWSAFEYGPVQ